MNEVRARRPRSQDVWQQMPPNVAHPGTTPSLPLPRHCANIAHYATQWQHEEVAVAAFHEFTMNASNGEPLSFEQYKGAACLVVNLASQ